ncbi:MAG: hypothetical protein QM703_21825 [Gemmatales bacterium]
MFSNRMLKQCQTGRFVVLALILVIVHQGSTQAAEGLVIVRLPDELTLHRMHIAPGRYIEIGYDLSVDGKFESHVIAKAANIVRNQSPKDSNIVRLDVCLTVSECKKLNEHLNKRLYYVLLKKHEVEALRQKK